VVAAMARAGRKKKRKRGGGDGDALLDALQNLYYGGCTLKMLKLVVKNLKPFLKEKFQEPILTCLKTITSMFEHNSNDFARMTLTQPINFMQASTTQINITIRHGMPCFFVLFFC